MHDVALLQLAHGKEQAIQLGELKKYVSMHPVQVYPLENEQTLQPAGQG